MRLIDCSKKYIRSLSSIMYRPALYGTAQFKLEAWVRVTRVYFVASLRVFFKIVCVYRQLHENFTCDTHTCDVIKHAHVRTCMHVHVRNFDRHE